MKICRVCGHAEHKWKCNHLEPLGAGWDVCFCGWSDHRVQQEIVNAFDRLYALMPAEQAARSRAYCERVQLEVCGRVLKPTVA